MKKKLSLSILLLMMAVSAIAEESAVVRRMTTEEIVQNQTPAVVAYNITYAILQRDFFRLLSYTSLHDAFDVQETIRKYYGDYQEGIDAFFSLDEYANIQTWNQALDEGYEVVVTGTDDYWLAKVDGGTAFDPDQKVINGMVYLPGDPTPHEGIHEVRVYVACCSSSEIGRKTGDEITRYNDTHVEVILLWVNNRWQWQNLYFFDGTEVEETEAVEIAELPADFDIEFVTEDGDDGLILIKEPDEEPSGLNDYSETTDDVVFKVVETMPSFPGGDAAMMEYIRVNIRYPSEAQQIGIQGRAIIEFVVEKNGSIAEVKVVRSAGDASLDREALRLVRSMPRWSPGKQRGKLVRVSYMVPINFKIQ